MDETKRMPVVMVYPVQCFKSRIAAGNPVIKMIIGWFYRISQRFAIFWLFTVFHWCLWLTKKIAPYIMSQLPYARCSDRPGDHGIFFWNQWTMPGTEKNYFMILNYYDKSETKLYFWKRLLLFPPMAYEKTLILKISRLSGKRFEIVKEIIAENMDAGLIRWQDADTVAFSFFAILHGLLSSMIIYKPDNLMKHYENIGQNFWNGIQWFREAWNLNGDIDNK